MTEYDIRNAAKRIDGYLTPRPHEMTRDAFERAKGETLANMRLALEQTESLTFGQWLSETDIPIEHA
jgi:hypothetical protein